MVLELEKEHLSWRVTAQEFTWPPEWLFDAKEKGNDKWHQEEYFVPKFVTQRKNYSALTTLPQLQSVRQEIAVKLCHKITPFIDTSSILPLKKRVNAGDENPLF